MNCLKVQQSCAAPKLSRRSWKTTRNLLQLSLAPSLSGESEKLEVSSHTEVLGAQGRETALVGSYVFSQASDFATCLQCSWAATGFLGKLKIQSNGTDMCCCTTSDVPPRALMEPELGVLHCLGRRTALAVCAPPVQGPKKREAKIEAQALLQRAYKLSAAGRLAERQAESEAVCLSARAWRACASAGSL